MAHTHYKHLKDARGDWRILKTPPRNQVLDELELYGSKRSHREQKLPQSLQQGREQLFIAIAEFCRYLKSNNAQHSFDAARTNGSPPLDQIITQAVHQVSTLPTINSPAEGMTVRKCDQLWVDVYDFAPVRDRYSLGRQAYALIRRPIQRAKRIEPRSATMVMGSLIPSLEAGPLIGPVLRKNDLLQKDMLREQHGFVESELSRPYIQRWEARLLYELAKEVGDKKELVYATQWGGSLL